MMSAVSLSRTLVRGKIGKGEALRAQLQSFSLSFQKHWLEKYLILLPETADVKCIHLTSNVLCVVPVALSTVPAVW
jgi:hypothetical protein